MLTCYFKDLAGMRQHKYLIPFFFLLLEILHSRWKEKYIINL